MELKEFISARFLTPPITIVFFVVLANPPEILLFFNHYNSLVNLVIAPSILLALGFLISTGVTAFYINPLKKRVTVEDKDIDELPERYEFLKFPSGNKPYSDAAKEVATWFAVMDFDDKSKKENLEYIRNQLHKRWNAYNASINGFASVCVSAIAVIFLLSTRTMIFWEKLDWWGWVWTAVFILFLLAFNATARNTYRGVKDIDNIMIGRIKNIS